MQRPWISAFALALLASGCRSESPAETAERDARDVAEVKALQKVHPPLQPIAPQPMRAADFAEAEKLARPYDTPGGSPPDTSACAFFPGSTADDAPVLAADAKRAVLKIGGDLVVLASDSGSPKLMPGLHTKYVGRIYSARLTNGPDSLSIRDRFDRIVYEAGGAWRCDEAPAR